MLLNDTHWVPTLKKHTIMIFRWQQSQKSGKDHWGAVWGVFVLSHTDIFRMLECADESPGDLVTGKLQTLQQVQGGAWGLMFLTRLSHGEEEAAGLWTTLWIVQRFLQVRAAKSHRQSEMCWRNQEREGLTAGQEKREQVVQGRPSLHCRWPVGLATLCPQPLLTKLPSPA